jgi:type II restriction/modification system DNA methylase subunit YeeA
MLGLELNEYAAELARVTVWIGELQWRLTHGYEFKTNPVLEPLDCIECRDALITVRPEPVEGSETPTGRAEPVEADWPKASVVVGNPPFLGGSKKRRELGDAYFEALDKVYAGRVPGGADLVCYWFDKALKAIEINGLGAAGLVATQSIRSGSNRAVLEAISKKTCIFDAWSDEPWVNDGAAVRVSLVSFGWGECCFLNGEKVDGINAELSNATDMTLAKPLKSNAGVAFQGPVKVGSFDIAGDIARKWLTLPNVNGRSNAEVLRPWANGQDIAKRSSDTWIVDFGVDMTESDATQFESPYSHVFNIVKPMREAGNRQSRKDFWWLHGETVPGMRRQLTAIQRYIVTPRVATHRFFVWQPTQVLPDSRLYAIARADDASFGILSSRIHEVWSLANASMHGVGNDPTYNAKSCFETFPFPVGLTPQDTASQQTRRLASGAVVPDVKASTGSARTVEAIAEAAHKLTTLRDNWLNPPDWTQRLPEVVPLGMSTSPYPDRIVPKPGHEKELSERTLTKLYNARPAWLSAAHAALDAAVATAYGWTDYTAEMADEVILQRLLALNIERSVERSVEKVA